MTANVTQNPPAQEKPDAKNFTGTTFSIVRPHGKGGLYAMRKIKINRGVVVSVDESQPDFWDILMSRVENEIYAGTNPR